MMKRDRHSGKIINDRYELLRLIDEGGMGAVYLGRDIRLGRRAAVKFLHAEITAGDAAVKRFYREGQAASAVNHPNIISVFDVGVSEWGEPFLVMEYLSGENLGSILKHKKRLDSATALGIMEPALRGLSAAHDQNIVHRDLKPENIFVVRIKDGSPIVKLIDFGISKVVETNEPHLTKTGAMLGTPSYMSPEQARGKGNFDHRADLYSMGVILYLILTGGHPFVGESYNDLIINILTEPPRDPFSINPDFPRDILPIIDKLLEKEPDKRYSDCKALLAALETLEAFDHRADALNALASDMAPDRFDSDDFESPFMRSKDSDDLAATVYAKMGPDETIAVDPDSATDGTGSKPMDPKSPATVGAGSKKGEQNKPDSDTRESKKAEGRKRNSERELSWDMIPSQVPPPHVRKPAARSIWPTFFLLFFLFCGGAAAVLGWDMYFSPTVTAPDRNLDTAAKSQGGVSEDTAFSEPKELGNKTQLSAVPTDEDKELGSTVGDTEKLLGVNSTGAPSAAGLSQSQPSSSVTGESGAAPPVAPLPGASPPSLSQSETPKTSASDASKAQPSSGTSGTKPNVASELPKLPKTDNPLPPMTPPTSLKEEPEEEAVQGDETAPLKPQQIDHLLDLKTSKIQNCYDMARISDPSLKGRLVLVVGMGGEDVTVTVQKNELSPYLASCVKRVIGDISPPANDGTLVEIQKEFVFEVSE
jgi:serine/threonine protein kinase